MGQSKLLVNLPSKPRRLGCFPFELLSVGLSSSGGKFLSPSLLRRFWGSCVRIFCKEWKQIDALPFLFFARFCGRRRSFLLFLFHHGSHYDVQAIPLFVTSLFVPLLLICLRVIRSPDGTEQLSTPDATKSAKTLSRHNGSADCCFIDSYSQSCSHQRLCYSSADLRYLLLSARRISIEF